MRSFCNFNNNNITRKSMNHCRIVSILRVPILRDCVGNIYQALIKSLLIYPSDNDIFVIFVF